MEVLSCTQEVSRHATSLLATLNLLRCRALFCDCVVREGGNSAHLYPAHRCVLAASSPVFAALLASSGALLELHDPRLPAAVLVHVLDYIYTGVVPSLGGPQLSYRLLGAAEYLQMEGLLRALRAGPTDDGGFDTRAGDGLHSDSTFWDTPVKPLDKSSYQYTANAEDLMEPHHGINTTNKISCIKPTEVNTASDIHPRSEHTTCMNVISSPVVRAEGQARWGRSQARWGRSQARWGRSQEQDQQRSWRTRERRKNLRTRVNTRKHLCLSLTYRQREKLRRNKMEEDTKVGISTVSRMTNASTSSPAPPDPNPVPLHNKSPPPLPHRSQPVIHHSSEALPLASLLVGYTTHARRTPCGCPRSTAEEEERTPRSNDTQYTADGGPTADTEQDGPTSRDWRSENPMEDTPEVQEQNIVDYVREHCDVYEACLKGNMVSNRLFKGDCEDILGCGAQGTQNNDVGCGQAPVEECKDCSVRWGISQSEKPSDHHSFHKEERRERPYDRELQSGGENATHTQVAPVASASGVRVMSRGALDSLPVTGLSPGSENYHANPFPRRVPGGQESHGNQDGFYSLQSTFDLVKGSLSTSYQPEKGSGSCSDQPDQEKEHPGSCPLQGFNIGSDPQISTAPPVDKASNHTDNDTEERSYLGNLRYQYLPSEPSRLMETHSHSNQEDRIRPSSHPNQSLMGEQVYGREPAAKLLFLDISSSDETRTQAGQETGGAACSRGPGTLSNMDDRDLVTSLTTSAAASMPRTSLSLSTPSGPPTGRSSTESQQLYQCSLCERSFSQRGSLNRHVRSHLGVRPYLCPRCPMTFSRQYRVTEHMRVHQRCVLEATDPSRPPES